MRNGGGENTEFREQMLWALGDQEVCSPEIGLGGQTSKVEGAKPV